MAEQLANWAICGTGSWRCSENRVHTSNLMPLSVMWKGAMSRWADVSVRAIPIAHTLFCVCLGSGRGGGRQCQHVAVVIQQPCRQVGWARRAAAADQRLSRSRRQADSARASLQAFRRYTHTRHAPSARWRYPSSWSEELLAIKELLPRARWHGIGPAPYTQRPACRRREGEKLSYLSKKRENRSSLFLFGGERELFIASTWGAREASGIMATSGAVIRRGWEEIGGVCEWHAFCTSSSALSATTSPWYVRRFHHRDLWERWDGQGHIMIELRLHRTVVIIIVL